MAYITETDIRLYLTEAQISTIKRANETSPIDHLANAMRSAEGYVKDRLSYKYDIEAEYAKTGSDRNPTLLEVLARIAVRKALMAFDMVDRNGNREADYEEAKEQLERIEKGAMLSDVLPKNTPDSSKTIQWGYTEKLDPIY